MQNPSFNLSGGFFCSKHRKRYEICRDLAKARKQQEIAMFRNRKRYEICRDLRQQLADAHRRIKARFKTVNGMRYVATDCN